MVSDHSSIAFEYMLLDRPLVVVDRPELLAGAAINPEKVRQIRAAADVATDARSATEAIVRALRRPERYSPERHEVAGKLFYRPGTATDRAVALLYHLIGLTAYAAPQSAEHQVIDRVVAAG
jgi:CDP-glycerol glycerophosphotransferase (TagB/SpsB family)